jgi:hypothetical protein
MNKSGGILAVLNFFLIFVIIILLGFLGYLIYLNFPRATEEFAVQYQNNLSIDKNIPSNIQQFEEGMRFNHNELTYFILDCSENKINKLKEAFSIIESGTGIITFRETTSQENADIDVGCSERAFEEEKNSFVAGEGGPTKWLNLSLYPVILKGKIILYRDSECNYPVVELHELLHVFGFEHVSDESKLMYPYVDCKQKIDEETLSIIKRLYSIEPKAELYFQNVSVYKTGIYLNFSAKVINGGLIDARNVSLEIYSDGEKIDEFSLKDIEVGSSQILNVGNMKTSSLKAKIIELRIISETEEFDLTNNRIEASVKI